MVMGEAMPRGEPSRDYVIRKALDATIDPIGQALLAAEGDKTIIVKDATGTPREVIFQAPEFPPTYEE